jgi:hypothetical protein
MKLFLLILLSLYCYDSLAFLLPSIVSLRLRMFKQNSECVLSAESPQFQREKPYFLRKALMAGKTRENYDWTALWLDYRWCLLTLLTSLQICHLLPKSWPMDSTKKTMPFPNGGRKFRHK